MIALQPWLSLLIVIGLTGAFLALFHWIFSLDEDPLRKQGVDYIPLRPLAKSMEVVFMFGGSIALVSGVDSYLRGDEKGISIATFGLAFTLFAAFVFNTHLWLDDEGVHYRTGVGKVQSILWKDLRYYDVQRVTGMQSGTTVYFRFHSTDDTVLSISRTSYNIDSLLEKIRQHGAIHEQPYKKQSWFADR